MYSRPLHIRIKKRQYFEKFFLVRFFFYCKAKTFTKKNFIFFFLEGFSIPFSVLFFFVVLFFFSTMLFELCTISGGLPKNAVFSGWFFGPRLSDNGPKKSWLFGWLDIWLFILLVARLYSNRLCV